MNVPAVLKNKKVLIGVGGAAVLVIGVMMLRGKGAAQSNDAGDAGFDNTYYSLPPVQTVTDSSNQTVNASQLLDYAKGQTQLTANMNFAAIAAQSLDSFVTQMIGKTPAGTSGILGKFDFGGTPISFDYTFKDKKAVISSPPQTATGAVVTHRPTKVA